MGDDIDCDDCDCDCDCNECARDCGCGECRCCRYGMGWCLIGCCEGLCDGCCDKKCSQAFYRCVRCCRCCGRRSPRYMWERHMRRQDILKELSQNTSLNGVIDTQPEKHKVHQPTLKHSTSFTFEDCSYMDEDDNEWKKQKNKLNLDAIAEWDAYESDGVSEDYKRYCYVCHGVLHDVDIRASYWRCNKELCESRISLCTKCHEDKDTTTDVANHKEHMLPRNMELMPNNDGH